MLPTYFLDSPEGQRHLLKKRRERCLQFIFDFEPKGYKKSSDSDKAAFSQAIVKKMKKRGRKSFRSALALKISIAVSSNTPLPIQKYPKTYIDLLHQKYHRENISKNKSYVAPADRDRLLMLDDSQIKFLSVDIHYSDHDHIIIKAYKFEHLVQDLAFLRSTLTHYPKDKSDDYQGYDQTFNPDKYRDLLSENTRASIKYDIEYSRQSNLFTATDFSFDMFRQLMSGYERNDWDSKKQIKDISEILRDDILNFPSCVSLCFPPSSNTTVDYFKKRITNAVDEEMKKYRVQESILHPLHCTILVIQPDYSQYSGNRIDLDNYAFNYILPIIHNTLSPQVSPCSIFNATHPLANESKRPQTGNGLPKSLVQYSVIEIPRLARDPKEGLVFMFIGKTTSQNCFWTELDSRIDRALKNDESEHELYAFET